MTTETKQYQRKNKYYFLNEANCNCISNKFASNLFCKAVARQRSDSCLYTRAVMDSQEIAVTEQTDFTSAEATPAVPCDKLGWFLDFLKAAVANYKEVLFLFAVANISS